MDRISQDREYSPAALAEVYRRNSNEEALPARVT
jgi:hypothetical protein